MKGNLSKRRNSIGNVYKKTEVDRLFFNSKSELKKYVDSAAGGKVDKVDGKGLSANDYTDAEKAEVAKVRNKVDKVSGKGLSTNDYTDADKAEVAKVKNKVDKVSGKGLSTNDYTDSDKAEVAKVKDKANVNDVLTKTNAAEFTPASDYQPATKKYVDDFIKCAFMMEYEINDSDGGTISDSDEQPILGRVDARVNVIDAVLKLEKKVERLEEAVGELKK